MVADATKIFSQYTSFTLDNIEAIYTELQGAESKNTGPYDLSHVTDIDTAGAQLLLAFALSTEATYQNCSQAVMSLVSETGLNSHFPTITKEVSG